jgi:hypothetical protein
LVSVSLPESLTSWGWDVFSLCHSLTSIQLPSKLNYIASSAYWNCLGLVNIKIPESIERIEGYAFEYCYCLKSVSLPSKLTEIGDRAFHECLDLESVVTKNPVPPTIGSKTFSKCQGVTLYVPKGCIGAYRSADYWRYFEHIIEMTGVKGDVNQDGEVAVGDVMMAVAAILGNERSLIPLEFADMDGDGNISVGDVMAIVGIVLNK